LKKLTGLLKNIKIKKLNFKFISFSKFFNWLKSILKETLAQTFTLLGFFIAWLTLTGTAKDIVGIAILVSLGLWLLTIGFRK
tara:strand:- start:1837 stop:2082 length:246 start_codon:yes stop_codon:yes gene_type:complete